MRFEPMRESISRQCSVKSQHFSLGFLPQGKLSGRLGKTGLMAVCHFAKKLNEQTVRYHKEVLVSVFQMLKPPLCLSFPSLSQLLVEPQCPCDHSLRHQVLLGHTHQVEGLHDSH